MSAIDSIAQAVRSSNVRHSDYVLSRSNQSVIDENLRLYGVPYVPEWAYNKKGNKTKTLQTRLTVAIVSLVVLVVLLYIVTSIVDKNPATRSIVVQALKS